MIAGLRGATAQQIGAIQDEAVAETARYFRENAPPEAATVDEWLEYLLPVSEALANVNLPKVPKDFKEQMRFLRGDKKDETIYERLKTHRASSVVRRLATRFFDYLEREKEQRGLAQGGTGGARTSSGQGRLPLRD